ncbi:MAG: SRPBCC domain-containing protein [Crocinitomicaceae bacterium]|nr:SRPBCC domain-containing protein [Crocinitomicaceae bacterium]MBK8926469.1 SRPBCC domain-containing protein [Crocinitomicaceae bacterium]
MDSIEVSCVLPVDAATVYRDWLSSKAHTLFTGSTAKVEPFVGGKHSAWEGYIYGETVELESGKRIVQTWSTSNFPDGAEPSRLEINLENVAEGCKVTLKHTNIPDGQGADYEQGWFAHYFTPMMDYYA